MITGLMVFGFQQDVFLLARRCPTPDPLLGKKVANPDVGADLVSAHLPPNYPPPFTSCTSDRSRSSTSSSVRPISCSSPA